MKGFEWPEGASSFSVRWKVEAPPFYFLMYIILPAAFLLVIYVLFRSFYVVGIMAAALIPTFVVFLAIGAIFHPMHYGKRSYNDGYLLSGDGYFGIAGKKSRNVYARFDTDKAIINNPGKSMLKFSNLHPVLVMDNAKRGVAGWSWAGASIMVDFNSESDLESFLNNTE